MVLSPSLLAKEIHLLFGLFGCNLLSAVAVQPLGGVRALLWELMIYSAVSPLLIPIPSVYSFLKSIIWTQRMQCSL